MKIDHIAIWTKDLERLKSFYQKYFNAESNTKYTNELKQFESYFLTFGSGARLELMQIKSIPDSKDDKFNQFTELIHFAIATGSKENVNLLTQQLKTDGYLIADASRKTGDGYYESVVLDPDGNRIELTI